MKREELEAKRREIREAEVIADRLDSLEEALTNLMENGEFKDLTICVKTDKAPLKPILKTDQLNKQAKQDLCKYVHDIIKFDHDDLSKRLEAI